MKPDAAPRPEFLTLSTESPSAERQNFRASGDDKPKPWVTILTPPNPYGKGARILLAFRNYRSKWWRVECFCKRPRKDGSCRITDQIVPLLAHPERTRFEHPKA